MKMLRNVDYDFYVSTIMRFIRFLKNFYLLLTYVIFEKLLNILLDTFRTNFFLRSSKK